MFGMVVQNGTPHAQSRSAGLILMEETKTPIPAGEFLKQSGLKNGQVKNGDLSKHDSLEDIFLKSNVELVEAVVTIEKPKSENGVQKHGMDAVDSRVIQENKNDVTDSAPLASMVSKFDATSRYEMNHKERGCFLIFDMEMFDSRLGLDSRIGTRRDAQNMFHTAKHMGFEYIKTFEDPTRNDVIDWMRAVSKSTHHGYDSFGCAILTHGEEDDVLYARDGTFKLSEITEMFTAENCPSLAGKPKLFFIQACRGDQKDAGAPISLRNLSNPVNHVSTKRPNQADFLIAYSTIPGFMSWRNTANGSWFVQALHHCFSQYAKSLELMQIMTKVNGMVAFFESYSGKQESGFKQIPAVTSRLTSEVYFWNCKFEEETNCPLCNSQLQSRDLSSSNRDVPSTSQSLNTVNAMTSDEKPKLHKKKQSKSFKKMIRESFRRKKKT